MSVVINGSAGVTVNSGAVLGITLGTAVASTSGTSIDFTSIPSWVKRITVMFSGVSTSGTSIVQIQLGAGSVTTSGYSCMGTQLSTSAIAGATATSGFVLGSDSVATDVSYGQVVVSTLGSNIWEGTGSTYSGATGSRTRFTAGGIALGGTLDRVRITTVNGTDTFDAGSINILYE